jgi:hypothetical protein
MWTAAQLVAQACEDAHVPGFTAQGQSKLQTILDTICFTRDYSSARGVYYFTLNPSLITTFGGFANFSGPYAFPLDYLRTSGSTGSAGVQWSFFYVFSGTPFQLVPWDLGKFDQQIQQPSSQSFPWAYATDMATETTAQDRLAATTSAATTLGSTQITLTLTPTLSPGGGGGGAIVVAAGGGIQIDSNGNIVLTGSTTSIVGFAIAGLGIAPGSFIIGAVNSIAGIMLDANGNIMLDASGAIIQGTAGTIMLSKPATGTFNNASVMVGTPPVAYIYPGPSGAFPATLRYQRLMPPLIDFNRIPWFPDQEFLLERLTASLMSGADDARRQEFFGRSDKLLYDYDSLADDKTSRAQVVVMDGNNFRAQSRRRLRLTKDIGW